MRTLLFCLLFSSASLSACTCAWTEDFCTYASGFFHDSDTSAVVRHVKFLGFRNPELGANLYDFVVLEHLIGGMIADTVTLWGQDGGNCNGPVRGLTEGDEYILLHSATQGVFSYYEHTLENFSNPYPIYDFQGCGPAALNVNDGVITGPIAPGLNSYTIPEFKTDISECIAGKLVSTIGGELPPLNFLAWPNPTPGTLNLAFPSIVTPERIDMLDITGRVVSTYNVAASQQVRSFSIDATGLPSGVYVARVLLENGRVGSKRIVIH